MAIRRTIVHPSRDRDNDVEVEKVPKKKVVEPEKETGDELDEVPTAKTDEEVEEDIPAVFRTAKKIVVPSPATKKIVVPSPVRKEKVMSLEVAKDEQEELLGKLPKDFETKTVNDVVFDNIIGSVMYLLRSGRELVITKVADNKWHIKLPTDEVFRPEGKPVPEPAKVKSLEPKNSGKSKLVGKEYDQEVCTSEYLEFVEGWREMDITEKRKLAKSLKLTWNKAADEKIENMALSRAVQEAKGITKYKPKYQSSAARAAVKG
jgi:hypothetical protein